MSRNLTSGTSDELGKSQVFPVIFAEAEFATGTLRLWTGADSISWNGETWIGAGQLLGIEPAKETIRVNATGLRLSLSGIDSANIANALVNARQNKPVNCWLGFMDSSGNIIVDPFKFFAGLVDILTIEEDGETSIITLQAENRLISLNRPKIRRYTDEDQKTGIVGFDWGGLTSGEIADEGFKHVVEIQEWAGLWGVPFPPPPPPPSETWAEKIFRLGEEHPD